MTVTDMKVLVIVPRMTRPGEDWRKYILPVGLAYISSILKHSGYEVNVLNLNTGDGLVDDIVRETLSREEYNFMLTGGLCTHYSAIKSCVDSVRKYAPFTRIVLGGGLISSVPELMFNALQPDDIVIGEGELTILELLKYLENNEDLSEVDGIGYRGPEGKVVLTKPREPIEDIDSLPWPDYEGLGLDAFLEQTVPSTLYYYDLFDDPRPYPIIASRSCPYQCTFCYHPLGDKYRQRSIPNVIDELAFAIERYKINIIEFYDELFSHDRERVYDFCHQLKQLSKSVPWEVKWTCQMRVHPIDEELVQTMIDAGCYLISLGLESYSPIVLNSMRKKITPQQIDKALRITRRLHMTITGNFIFGDVAETAETAYETLNYWGKNYHTLLGGAVALGFVQVYPGTAIYEHSLKKGIITNEIDFIENHLAEPINITDSMTEQEFEQLRIDINDAMLTYPKLQRPLLAKRINGVYEMHVKCPYCNVISMYKNHVPPGRNSYHAKAICCRNCRMRFFVTSSTHNLYISVLRIIGAKNAHLLNPLRRFYKTIIGYLRKLSTA